VSDIASSVDLALGLETQDSTTFGSAARRFAGGLFTADLTAGGYADMTGYDSSLLTNFRARSAVVASVTADSADNSVAYTFAAINHELTPLSGSVGDMAAVSVGATTRDAYGAIRGNILLPLAARGTGSSTGTARQLGAVSATQRVFSALHVTAASGTTPTLDVTVRSDDAVGFPSGVIRTTHPQFTTTGSDIQSAAGPFTDDWWRVAYTIAGTTPSFTFVVIVGIA
jgi:hypothetical protein